MTHVAIDSCSYFLSKPNYKVLNPILNAKTLVIQFDELTGEELSSHNPRNNPTYIHECNGYNVEYKVEQKRIGTKTLDGVSIALKAKMLERDYLQGITFDNVSKLYCNLQSHAVIECSYTQFLKGRVSDVDVCTDFMLPNQFTDISHFLKSAKSSLNTSMFGAADMPRLYDKQTNKGIDIGGRNTSHVNEYTKIYAKGIELENRSRAFKDAYLDGVAIPDLRFEVNMRNIKMLRKHGLIKSNQDASLLTVLTNLQDEGHNIVNNMKNQYFPTSISVEQKTKADSLARSSEELVRIIAGIDVCIMANMAVEQTIDHILLMMRIGKNDKKRVKGLIRDMYVWKVSELTGSESDWW